MADNKVGKKTNPDQLRRVNRLVRGGLERSAFSETS